MGKELTEESVCGRLGTGAEGPMWAACEMGHCGQKGVSSQVPQECLPFVGMGTRGLQEKSGETDWLPPWEVLNIMRSVAGGIFEKDE